jgi:ClpP class serine protease
MSLSSEPKSLWRYEATGLLAASPDIFSLLFAPVSLANTRMGDCEVVHLDGPIGGLMGDDYEAIHARVQEACEGPCSTVVLRFGTAPGGTAASCFATARRLREMFTASGKRSIAYVDGVCGSAHYAIAASCDEIWADESAELGSLGVLHVARDVSQAASNAGVKIICMSSGERKTDFVEGAPVSASAIAQGQKRVDQTADIFFKFVAERRGLSPDVIKALDGAVFIAAEAVSNGLCDRVGTFIEATSRSEPVSIDEVKGALTALSSGENPEEAAVAKRMLAAIEEPAGDDQSDEDKEKEITEAKAQAEAAQLAAKTATDALQATVQALETSKAQVSGLTAKLETNEREQFLATRKDLSPELIKQLAGKSLEEVKALVNAIPPRAQAITTLPANVDVASALTQKVRTAMGRA